jgi:hypothetical protein
MPSKTIAVFAEDMTDEMSQDALNVSQEAFQQPVTQGHTFSAIADYIRKRFEKEHGKGWNAVVGRSFGAFITHEIKTYMYFTVVPGVYVLLWRA